MIRVRGEKPSIIGVSVRVDSRFVEMFMSQCLSYFVRTGTCVQKNPVKPMKSEVFRKSHFFFKNITKGFDRPGGQLI